MYKIIRENIKDFNGILRRMGRKSKFIGEIGSYTIPLGLEISLES